MLKLNLGCGEDYQEGYVNIDIKNDIGADLVFNVSNGFKSIDIGLRAIKKTNPIHNFIFEDNNTSSVDEIRAHDFLEHIHPDKVIYLIDEIWRVLRPDGIFDFSIPSTDGRGAFQDPTHRSWWNINSWFYWTNDDMRQQIGAKAKFRKEILHDIMTRDRVIHTRGFLRAVK